jgi:enhanced filamentous growth protein 1
MHSAPHISSAQPYVSHPAPTGPMPHYPQYPQSSVMPPGSHYAPPHAYGGYGYSNGVTSPQSATHPGPGPVGPQVQPQLPPPGMEHSTCSVEVYD